MSKFVSAWRIRDFAPSEGAPAGAMAGAGEGWIPAAAPGDTYVALIDAGRLADPYAARNEAAAAWVRDREWWWHARIEIEADQQLVFDGLDTFADIYLDGTLLGSADNMFRSWRFDLSGYAPGTHDLAVCFHPAIAMTGDAPLPVFAAFTDRISASRRTAMRKAQFGWGWDWGPDLPTVGIWQPVRIESKGATLRSLNFTTRSIAGPAEVTVDLDLSAPVDIDIELLDPQGISVATASRHGSGRIDMTVPDPQLWWTADLGEQPLYTLVANIGGQTINYRVGIRTIELDQSPDPDEPGTTFFRFLLNTVPLFAKGACWVPASSFVGAIPDATYTDLLERARGANFNMLRVWGGGIYEPDFFYRECDRLGLLVWQDFMFACAPYPDQDPVFIENIRQEVIEQVGRLRHHACLALWCGNNENQAIHWFADIAAGSSTPHVGQLYYDEVIPAVLADLDPETPYWPGSPWGGPSPNSMRSGDVHNWTVWHGIPLVSDTDPDGPYATTPEGAGFPRYAEDFARFVSEFGLQAAPDIGTLRRWMAPEDIVLGSAGFLERIKDVADKASAMMIPFTGLPETIGQFVDFTQLCQAEGLKFGIEHYRRRTPHCSGALIWQHNDCWPCVSWSLIDYDGVAKSAWYATRRAFAPVLASFRIEDGIAELWVTNDTRAPLSDSAAIALTRLAGGTEWEESVPLEVGPNSSACLWRGPATYATGHILTVRSAGGIFPDNRALLAPAKDLLLASDPGLRISSDEIGDALRIFVATERYALAVQLRSDDPALRFDDNHFDLAGGEQRIVTVTRKGGGPVARADIAVSSWNGRG
ncbi:hypothetical protein P6144_20390 [Sphingomonas sp. HITSZ_GF]|uniref:beta-mannosidase n=1 Tax=Sphingomonas sp. HITSZ_GF TaxID=3037247 RepID=UPI00240D1BE0|nr:glycoside hydrolase family 2 protein [Sphingomonas sp. HITSZ_GF]MDG2536031.1 hypothetical protein [Sphingomonas sp. HITSZ_GF]